MGIDRTGSQGGVVPPDAVQKKVPCRHAPLVGQKMLKKLELDRRQPDFFLFHLHEETGGIDMKNSKSMRLRLFQKFPFLDPLQDRPDAQDKLARAERFGEVIVGPDL